MLGDTFALHVRSKFGSYHRTPDLFFNCVSKPTKVSMLFLDPGFIITEPSMSYWNRLRLKVQVLELSGIITIESCMVAGHYGLVYGA